MALHNHNIAQQQLGGNVTVDAGVSQHSQEFQQQYQLNPQFELTCTGCCFQYLTQVRQYQWVGDAIRRVKFGNATTSCYVDGKQGHSGVHGVVKTGVDPNLGQLGPRTVSLSHSFQLYGPVAPTGLAVGANMTARIEAIAVNQITGRIKVLNCYFSYADATLLELYLQEKNRPSLNGQCCWPIAPQEHQPAQQDQGPVDALAKGINRIGLSS